MHPQSTTSLPSDDYPLPSESTASRMAAFFAADAETRPRRAVKLSDPPTSPHVLECISRAEQGIQQEAVHRWHKEESRVARQIAYRDVMERIRQWREDARIERAIARKNAPKTPRPRRPKKPIEDRIALTYLRHKAIRDARVAAKERQRSSYWDDAHVAARADRANGYMHKRRALVRGTTTEGFTRSEVFARDRGFCHLCGKKVDPRHWHLDHIIPLSRGGPHTKANVAVSHPRCNLKKGVKIPAQLRLLS